MVGINIKSLNFGFVTLPPFIFRTYALTNFNHASTFPGEQSWG
jgi:hypothetical protein